MSALDPAVRPRPLPARTRRALEALALFVGVPVAHVAFYQQLGTFGPVAAMVAVGVLLLALTPTFRWRELVQLSDLRGQGGTILAYTAVAAAVIVGLVLWLVPYALLSFPQRAPTTWAMVMVLYPWASVLGQELLYRPLFFRRYGDLFPRPWMLVSANAAGFALMHAFYQNPVALGLSFAGGLVFAELYRRTGSFPLLFVLHTIGGWLVFTSGLGLFFYHGAIPG
jgi:membrane protease YdiL (CAAX protease family)